MQIDNLFKVLFLRRKDTTLVLRNPQCKLHDQLIYNATLDLSPRYRKPIT